MKPIALWPGSAPGDKGDIGEEKDTTSEKEDKSSPKYVIRLGNVTQPTITVYSPPIEKNTGAAVVVCPGGGYSILAMNLEGTEVCEWLNSVGVTAVLLKYRVPARKDRERYAAPLQDAQRAIGIVRHRAKEWAIDPGRIGILGFSAGGHLSAATCASAAARTYPAVDEADTESCRPDFCILIYPAYLATDDLTRLAPEIKVSHETPPGPTRVTPPPAAAHAVMTTGISPSTWPVRSRTNLLRCRTSTWSSRRATVASRSKARPRPGHSLVKVPST